MHRYKQLLICKALECDESIPANVDTAGVTIMASNDAREAVMKQFIIATLATGLTVGALIAAAPPAKAGCQFGGGLVEKMCDGPVQDDGTWQRCVTQHSQDVVGRTTCQMMGPGQNPLGLAYYNPPTHIDG
jgi:hypothetical protein